MTEHPQSPRLRNFFAFRLRVPIGMVEAESLIDANDRVKELWDGGVRAYERYELDDGLYLAAKARQLEADLDEDHAEQLAAECLRMDRYVREYLKKHRGFE